MKSGKDHPYNSLFPNLQRRGWRERAAKRFKPCAKYRCEACLESWTAHAPNLEITGLTNQAAVLNGVYEPFLPNGIDKGHWNWGGTSENRRTHHMWPEPYVCS